MKNSTLLFRSLFFIILIAGSAHLVTYASQNNTEKLNNPLIENTSTNTTTPITEKAPLTRKKLTNPETDYIVGRWKVDYNNTDFKGAIIYEIRKENIFFNAYLSEYQDKNGNSQKAKNEKTLVIKSFDGYKGKGKNMITYEGKKYNIDCNINMLDENTFKLSYDYYGYSDIETWKKQ